MASMASTDLSYGDYQMEIVLGEKPEELRHEIVEFWKANRALRTGPEERWRRSAEVALIARNGKREIVGVSTVYVRNFRTPDNKYYFYRMFIRESDRVPGMMRFMTLTTRDALDERHEEGGPPAAGGPAAAGGPKGVVIVTENKKLMRPGMRRMMERGGFTLAGKSPKGFDVWRYDFGTAEIGAWRRVRPQALN